MTFNKLKFISLAKVESLTRRKGNLNKAGPEIEKYLSALRSHLGIINPKYFDLAVGFDWCCAFVYYLLLEAGYALKFTPLKNSSWHLGAVRTWYEFALQEDKFLNKTLLPQSGDLVIFDHLVEDVELDHIGIVLDVKKKFIITAEGNVNNSTGRFHRNKNNNIRGYIRL